MAGAEQLINKETILRRNIYRASVMFVGDGNPYEIAIVALSPEDAVRLIRYQLDDLTTIGAPTLAIADAYLMIEQGKPPQRSQLPR